MQLTIEHDPDSISRKISQLTSLSSNSSPLTTTKSDTNIPINNNIPLDVKSFGSSDSVNNEKVRSSENIICSEVEEKENKKTAVAR